MTKNIGKSIRTRLLNLAKEEKQEYMKVLVRYLHERLLFRISASPYKSHFLLKGSSLLFALDGFKARPTIDIDLLGERISNDKGNLKVVFEKICSIECEDDGVFFDASSLELEPIAIDKKCNGIRGRPRSGEHRDNNPAQMVRPACQHLFPSVY